MGRVFAPDDIAFPWHQGVGGAHVRGPRAPHHGCGLVPQTHLSL